MKKILLTLLFIASTIFLYGYGTSITIEFKNGDIFTYNYTVDTGCTITPFTHATTRYEQWYGSLDALPTLVEGEEEIIGNNTVWQDKAEAVHNALLDIRQAFRSRGYRGEVWSKYFLDPPFLIGTWEQAVYFDKKDVKDVKIESQ
ncbi:MAG: hypothetical protein Pg6B_11110 [Candidatus Azobacteroides pseudotrichonymphae]|nr:MAG: hypothetical protein Pg6B_11110 [Candidatus Azobacteroides pseudotrichonymphae]